MGRVRTLNGIPNEVVVKYLSKLEYGESGYMVHWLWKIMNDLHISKAEIDIFAETTVPEELPSKPILIYLESLRRLISKQLVNYKFNEDYIAQGVLKIAAEKMGEPFGVILIHCILITRENKQIKGKVFELGTYPIADSLFDKVMKENP